MENFSVNEFLASGPVNLWQCPTRFRDSFDEEIVEEWLDKVQKKLAKIQDKMYSHNRYAVLICLQGMDTAGKDSLIREVFKELNVRGIVVHSFKTPTSAELEHDYMWRHYLALPEKGKFAVFNRTHYENVLVTRVHPEYILNENIPGIESVDQIDEAFWDSRFESINHFERHLAQNGTIVLKFFLNLGKEEQRQRLLRRLDEEKHNWKFSPGDLRERKLWDAYISCYEDLLSRTSHTHAPWFIVPADDKPLARYIVGKIILESLEQYAFSYPELDDEVRDNIAHYRRDLESE